MLKGSNQAGWCGISTGIRYAYPELHSIGVAILGSEGQAWYSNFLKYRLRSP
jgi:hypothetical protein